MSERDDRDATIDAASIGASGADSASGSYPRAAGAAGELVPGQRFAGRYLVEGLLGRGGMGSVWRVRDELVGEVVALKVLALPPDGAERALERFRQEVRLARRITSPHVARTHDLGSQSGVHFLTMELIEGPSLSRVLEGGPLPAERAARIGAQIAEGLSAAHAAGVVHRDLKPDNVLVEARTSRVVVTDFGIARALDADGGQRTGGIVGTPLYMAPEQIVGQAVDARTDVYALGLVLFEMLTGQLAFSGDTPIAAAMRRLAVPPPDPRTLAAVPDVLAELVLRCLARDPGGRYPDAASVAQALAAFVGIAPGASLVGLSMPPASATGQLALGAAPTSGALSVSTPRSMSGATPSGARLPVAPLLENHRALAVVPFGYRGPSDQDWLAAGIGDELIDVLSRTRGLRVLGRGAVDRCQGTRDPREIGRALEVDFVIDGTVQVAGSKVRVTVRLIDVRTGVQQWSERFDSEVEDVFEVQERVAKRIAESLRLSLHGVGTRAAVSPEAVELYLRARQRQRSAPNAPPFDVIEMFERALELAPDFAAAYAGHASACVRAWMLPVDRRRDWRTEAVHSVARALERAPDVAETHLASAQLAVQEGRYREAVAALRTALSIAPTLPEAHQTLAMLQIEAGRAKEGLERLDLALELEPTLSFAQFEKARWHGCYGDVAIADEVIERWAEDPTKEYLRMQLLTRIGAFRRDEERLRKGLALLEQSTATTAPLMALYARVMLGDRDALVGVAKSAELLRGAVSDRFRALVHQLSAEVWGRMGEGDKALEHVRAAADAGVLLDLEWIDRCPLLEPARAFPELAELRKKVRSRCEAIWTS